MLIQPTLQRLMLQTGLLPSFLVYLVSINFVPRCNKFSIYQFYHYFNHQRHWCSLNEPFVSFYNVFYYKIQHIYMVSLCHLVIRGFQVSSMRTVVFLELIICRRPILFEHNCTYFPNCIYNFVHCYSNNYVLFLYFVWMYIFVWRVQLFDSNGMLLKQLQLFIVVWISDRHFK